MERRVAFQLYYPHNPPDARKVEVMEVDWAHWKALKEVIATDYASLEPLAYINQDLPILLKHSVFIQSEGDLRKIDVKNISEEAYIALFSLDIFIRQLDDLEETDIRFELK